MSNCLHTQVGLITIALLLLCPQLGQAQITISRDDVLSIKGKMFDAETDTSSNGSVMVGDLSLGTKGGSQMWDLGAVPIPNPFPFAFEYTDPGGTPFAGEFPSANFVQNFRLVIMGTTVDLYQYLNVTETAIVILGTAAMFGGFTFIDRDGRRLAVLPLTFGSNWQDTVVNVDTSISTIVTIDSTITRSMADAWGTIRLSGGDFECLRICVMDTSWKTTIISGTVTSRDTTFTISYIFSAKNEFFVGVIESQDNESDPNFTDASSFIRLTVSPATSVQGPSDLDEFPTSFLLSQNFPNPFNPETQIRYTIGATGRVELTVFDINGRQIRTFISESVPPGQHTVNWDGTDASGKKVASGHYVYQLKANGQVRSKMMILVK